MDDLNKFRQSRRDFKRIMNEKMKLNDEDSDDSALISKKFWKYVKSKSKSSRIPETIRYGDQFRNLPEDQANLFNKYFFEQFSQESSYDIDIDLDHSDSSLNNIKIHVFDVYLILKEINAGKALYT